jgi:hypothetical protein
MAKVLAARQHGGDGLEAYGMMAMRIMGKFDAGTAGVGVTVLLFQLKNLSLRTHATRAEEPDRVADAGVRRDGLKAPTRVVGLRLGRIGESLGEHGSKGRAVGRVFEPSGNDAIGQVEGIGRRNRRLGDSDRLRRRCAAGEGQAAKNRERSGSSGHGGSLAAVGAAVWPQVRQTARRRTRALFGRLSPCGLEPALAADVEHVHCDVVDATS